MIEVSGLVFNISLLMAIALTVATLAVSVTHRHIRHDKSEIERLAGRVRRYHPEESELTVQDERVLSRLGWLLRNPLDYMRLLRDHALFLRAARQAIKEGILGEAEILRLARNARIPVRNIRDGQMTTRRLRLGSEISIIDPVSHLQVTGNVVSAHTDRLQVRVRRSGLSVRRGTNVDVLCNTSHGVYRFTTKIHERVGNILYMVHTDAVSLAQRRNHRRHAVSLPVSLRDEGGSTFQTNTVEISLSGAAIRNPQRTFYPGSPIELMFSTNGVRVQGLTKRTSRGGRVIHVKFGKTTEVNRRKLFRMIMGATSRS